jgi:hypothetical protein
MCHLQEYNASQMPRYMSFMCTNINTYLSDPNDGMNTSSSFLHSSCSGSSHSQSALEHAITHNVEELCSLFNCGLSGELDKDDNNEGDDPMVGEADGGDPPIKLGVNGSSGTADTKVWISVPISVQSTYGQWDDIVLGRSIHSQHLTEGQLANGEESAVTLAGERLIS